MDRKGYLGGSDTGPVFDLIGSAVATFLAATGQGEPDEPTEAMRMGTRLEPVVADIIEEMTGLKLYTPAAMVHPEFPYLRAHIDRLVEGDPTLGIEIKTRGPYAKGWGPDDTDETPQHVLTQCLFYMAMEPRIERFEVHVLNSGQKMQKYVVPRDQALIDIVIGKMVAFWENHVAKNVPPTAQTVEEARALWWKATEGKRADVPTAISYNVARIRDIRAERKTLKDEHDERLVDVLNAVKDAEILTYEGRHIATLKQNKDSHVFDKARFKAERADLYQQYLITKRGARVLRPAKENE